MERIPTSVHGYTRAISQSAGLVPFIIIININHSCWSRIGSLTVDMAVLEEHYTYSMGYLEMTTAMARLLWAMDIRR